MDGLRGASGIAIGMDGRGRVFDNIHQRPHPVLGYRTPWARRRWHQSAGRRRAWRLDLQLPSGSLLSSHPQRGDESTQDCSDLGLDNGAGFSQNYSRQIEQRPNFFQLIFFVVSPCGLSYNM